ncbi:hypothetical protein [Oceanobacillus massiliensis]|nr:hypothetical protein [Oceanobacillus massiliensis]
MADLTRTNSNYNYPKYQKLICLNRIIGNGLLLFTAAFGKEEIIGEMEEQ